VQRLDTRDVHLLVDAVTELGSVSNGQPFPSETLESLGTLISADWITYCELDRVARRQLAVLGRSDDGEEGPDEETFWRVEPWLPMCAQQRAGNFSAMRVSDLLTRREFHSSEAYAEWYRPWRIERELEVALPSPMTHTKAFIFNRLDAARDFTERDRLLLQLLQPHLIRRYARWAIQQRVAAGLAEAARNGADPAVLILGHGGRIEFAQRAVRQLLSEYFGEGDHGVAPMTIRAWAADHEQLGNLVIDGTDAQLVVSMAAGESTRQLVLLVHERSTTPSLTQRLTRRERDVLDLVADGKSNAEIGRLLWVQPSTIRKHLENAYSKLNVSNRTEATALLRREAARSQ
jgi:DNA-binding CsgD family transcriptional regulator